MPLIDDSMDESTPWFIEKLKQRYSPTDGGFIIDTHAGDSPVWCLTLPAFERWFAELESVTDQTLGRRLAHAAAESEEWRWNFADPLPKSWIGQQKKRMAVINADWAIRGVGQLQMIEASSERATLVVGNRGQTALSAGMANAVWEYIQDQRFRFQWSDRGAGETVVECTRDSRQIPAPKKSSVDWLDSIGDMNGEERFYDRARHESEGLWTVEGNRAIILSQDLLLRFEMLATPYLSTTTRSTDSRTEWEGVSEEERVVWWDAMAEASRRQFLASGDLVLIASAEHWISISKRHMALQGLGVVISAKRIDDYGGVELHASAALHPAILVGRLIGCWERAEGRPAKATWVSEKTGHRIRLESRREIA